jgi:prepilin-type processing-associated H-X9-DG protein
MRKIDWPNEKIDGKTLFIGTPSEIIHGNKANLTYLDGTPAISITDAK